MAKYIDNLNCNLLPFTKQINHRYLIYHELRFIDSWLDDRGLDSILATPRYRQATRKVTLTQLFRAELLKAWRYGEISYRKYGDLMINKLENKTVRSFLHLPLHKKTCLHHSQLSGFRTKMTITQPLRIWPPFSQPLPHITTWPERRSVRTSCPWLLEQSMP